MRQSLGRVEDWRLLGEGGAHLVYSYCGTEAAFRTKVIKIYKKTLPNEEGSINHIWQVLNLAPFVDATERIPADPRWISSLISSCQHLRRTDRIAAHSLFDNFERDYVLLQQNYHFPPATSYPVNDCGEGEAAGFISIEIKPKWHGALAFNLSANTATLIDHPKYCRFCSEHNPVANDVDGGASNSGGGYCPADLFSAQNDRIRKALQALLRWPKNNLKIFCNGLQIDPSEFGVFASEAVLGRVAMGLEEIAERLDSALIYTWTMAMSQGDSLVNSYTLSQDEWLRLAVALRDCSIIIGLLVSPAVSPSAGHGQGGGALDAFQVKLIDLDPNTKINIEKYQGELLDLIALTNCLSH